MGTLRAALTKAKTLPYDLESPVSNEDSTYGFDRTGQSPIILLPGSKRKARSLRRGCGDRWVASGYRDPVADIYRVLRARLLRRMIAQGVRSIGICSATDGEGKTTTAVNLAISFAHDPKYNTILVDLDLRKPSLNQYFSIPTSLGVTDYLSDRAGLEDCAVASDFGRLTIIPAGRRCLNSSELLSSPLLKTLFGKIRDQNSNAIIICDLPPLLASDDALVALSHIEAAILVVREGCTKFQNIQRCLELFLEKQLIGTVLNDSADQLNNGRYY